MKGTLKALLHAGPAAAAAAWIVIGLSWSSNSSWFVFTRDAFSDLGGPSSCSPHLYNYGLMLTGLLLALYGVAVAGLAPGRLEVSGGAYTVLAGVFLGLIGVYPSGTRPHVFVSTWFFIQMDAALVLTLLGAWRRKRSMGSLVGLALSISAFPVAGVVEAAGGWPSAAVLEAYGIILVDAAALLVYVEYLRGP